MSCSARHAATRWVAPRPTRAGRQGRRSTPGGNRTGPILVVEDDPMLRELLDEVLRAEGYAVAAASDGAAALALARRRTPGLILLDLRLPGMDGWAFACAYRTTPGDHAPIIVVTGSPDLAADAGLGAAAVLDKPFHLEELRVLVGRYLPPPSPAARTVPEGRPRPGGGGPGDGHGVGSGRLPCVRPAHPRAAGRATSMEGDPACSLDGWRDSSVRSCCCS